MNPVEYERRRQFLEDIKQMNRDEWIEIVRILRKNSVPFSENNSGILFDLTTLTQSVFDELIKFRIFMESSTRELAKRDEILMG